MADDLKPLALAHYEELARIGRALSSPVRLQLLDLVRQAPRSVEVLAEQAGVPMANVSQHLKLLRAAHLVHADKRGQRVVYRLTDEAISTFFGTLRDLGEALLPELDRLRRAIGGEPSDREELLAQIREGAVTLLDVRPLDEFHAGHVPGAVCIPLPELKKRLDELPKNRTVVATCRGPYCPMAVEAVRVLENAGFRAVHLDLAAPDLRARRWRLSIVTGEESTQTPAPAAKALRSTRVGVRGPKEKSKRRRS